MDTDAADTATTEMEGVVAPAAAPAEDDGSALTGEYTWIVRDFLSDTIDERIFSDTFTVGSCPWNMLLFPRGNKSDFLSAYVNAADAATAPDGWARRAGFTLTLVHPADPAKSVSKDAAHVFTAAAVDWGFTQFVPLADVRAGGFVDGAGCVTIKCALRVDAGAAAGGLYDCRAETGCVGLKNQGATCYMNSLLQTLYHINAFRKAVYHMPTSPDDEPHANMPLALQSLFYKLQFGPGAAPTKDLTRSFGWDTVDAFMQHDVQELNRVLCERLEAKMKGTAVDGTIAKLFEGHTHNFVECIHVDGVSTRTESFMDLQLDVKGCADVYASFDAYTAVETLDGANQYKSDAHGLQDARKGVLFDDFPPVLQLQLKRFEYDVARDAMVKINDRYAFPVELDLDAGGGKYLSKNADRSVRNLYRLHSVLVHSGGVHGGHYYAFIRPDAAGGWLRFDDERVTRESDAAAVDDQYGGGGGGALGPGGAPRLAKFSNAYMLVYIRVSDWDQIMAPVAETDVHEHVRARLRAEVAEKERRRKHKAEAHLYTSVRCATDADLAAHLGPDRRNYFDLFDHDGMDPTIRVKKADTLADAKAAAADAVGAPPAAQRWWVWARRQNATYRPARPLTAADDGLTMADVEKMANARAGMLDVYVEVAPNHDPAALPAVAPGDAPAAAAGDPILLFFKRYDPAAGTLAYDGHAILPRSTTVAALADSIAARAGVATPLALFEEVRFDPTVMVERLAPGSDLAAAQLEHGDIIVWQPAPEAAAADAAAPPPRHPTADAFLEWVRTRRMVIMKPLDDPKGDGFVVELAADNDYDTITAAVAAAVGAPDGDHVRLTQHNVYAGGPKPAPLRHRGVASLDAALTHYHAPCDTLYYEVIDMPLPALEAMKPLRVEWLAPVPPAADDAAAPPKKTRGAKAAAPAPPAPPPAPATHTLMLNRDATVADALAELATKLGPGAVPPGRRLRLLEIFYARIYKVFADDDRVDAINDAYWTLRAEPEDEGDDAPLADDERWVHVCHFSVGSAGAGAAGTPTTHGDPFLIRVRDSETLDDIKPRVRARLRAPVADADWDAWRFALCPHLRPPEYLAGGDAVGARLGKQARGLNQGSDPTYLGLEHAPVAGGRARARRPGGGGFEKAIKIN